MLQASLEVPVHDQGAFIRQGLSFCWVTPNVQHLAAFLSGDFSNCLPGKLGSWTRTSLCVNFFLLFSVQNCIPPLSLMFPYPGSSLGSLRTVSFWFLRWEERVDAWPYDEEESWSLDYFLSSLFLLCSHAPHPNFQRYLKPQFLSVSGLCLNELTSCCLLPLAQVSVF